MKINNEIYNLLGDRWYTAYDDPVALLRAETKIKWPWVVQKIKEIHGTNLKTLRVLDIGCGAGFLSNQLAAQGLKVFGVDVSEESLAVARRFDLTATVTYKNADAYALPFANQSMDIVTAMDFLEHVEDPERVIAEAARVLRPGGLFFFHTFNRNWLSHLLVIKVVEFLVKNTPRHMHVIELFITPKEMQSYCQKNGMSVLEITGLKPCFSTITIKGLLKRTVPENFQFELTRSLKLSYLGVALKATI